MNLANQALALAHAADEFPREACGLLIVQKGRETYIPCRNIGVGTDQFVIHPEDYVRADRLGEIVGVFHSHPHLPADSSQADKVACEASGLPWFIVSYPSGQWHETQPSGYMAPLVGRAWAHGVLDCYSVIRDWYRAERGIDLPNFDRFDEWWKRGQNLYLDNFGSAGFEALGAVQSQDMEVGDVLLMQVASPVPNHAAIYLGDGLILHHLQGRLSSRDVYGGYWQKITTHILRHRTEITQPP
ncbi:C40 family peptidase [Limnohabitans sp.]